MNGVGIVRYPNAVPSQLVPESYRPRAGGPRWSRQRRHALLQLLGTADQRLPGPLTTLGVERREDLAAAGIEDSKVFAVPFSRYARRRNSGRGGLRHSPPERVQSANPCHGQTEAGAQSARRGDADPQARERAWPEADREQVDLLPAARGGSAALHLLKQRGRVSGPPVRRGPQQRLVQSLAVAPGAGGGVGGRGVEADDNQSGAASSP